MLEKILKISLIITLLLIPICVFIDIYLVPIVISFFLLYFIYNVTKKTKRNS